MMAVLGVPAACGFAAPALRRAPVALKSTVSPFDAYEKDQKESGVAPPQTGALEFTMDNVDKVLEGVRPYLIADGGDCTVVKVDPATKNVILALTGACSTCASSTVTMKMGIEKVLRERWADLGTVTRDDDPENQMLSISEVEKLLEPISNALMALGASAKVLKAYDSTVEVKFTGPDNVRYGIELSLLDSPLITDIIWV